MNKIQFRLLFILLIAQIANPLSIFSGFAQQPRPINHLILKGTHNSYACCGGNSFWSGWDNTCPVMHNPPQEQMDDYGVWVLELDFSIELQATNPVLIVGHNGSKGDDTWTHPDWGTTLEDFLIKIRSTRAFQYRPVIIFFEKKNWGHSNYKIESAWVPLLENLLIKVFKTENIYGWTAFEKNQYNWPSVPELAGKIIPYTNSAYTSGVLFKNFPLTRWYKGDYTNAKERTEKIKSGSYNIISPDQYQADWTFRYTAPPNPLVVSSNALEHTQVVNYYGHDCYISSYRPDTTNVDNSFYVSQHGTFKFPFNKIAEAVENAETGWTILIKAGNYTESLIINKPLVLKSEGGSVVIQP